MRLAISTSIFHIGFDDTDSTDGSCTTFLCYNLVKRLVSSRKVKLLDYPNLIRLNPNVPWKTRGNAALSIRLSTTLERKKVFDICRNFVKRFAISPNANAGLVLYEGIKVPDSIASFANRALYTTLGMNETLKIGQEFELDSFSLRSRQGLVGATAAIGNTLCGDHTFELIAYRRNLSLPRELVRSRVIKMSMKASQTFSSYDDVHDRVMIAPHGPDPVLCGIRGETATAVKNAFNMLLPVKNLLGWMIFRSNQGTGEHLRETINLSAPDVYSSGKTFGSVVSCPKSHLGGHVFFELKNEKGSIICACYEPTASFRKNALMLCKDDFLEVGGGVRKPSVAHPVVLNLEYFKPLKLVAKTKYHNPVCSVCNISMSSMGVSQGYRCPKCRTKSLAPRSTTVEPRELIPNQVYIPPIKAQRHLTKPCVRYSIFGKTASIPVRMLPVWYH